MEERSTLTGRARSRVAAVRARLARSPTVRLLAALVLVGAVAFAARVPLLRAAGDFLVDADAPAPADLIYILSGDLDTRPIGAARLWHAGLAPRIALAEAEERPASRLGVVPTHTEAMLEVLRRLGVPDSALVRIPVAGGAGSTWDEADALRRHVVAGGIDRVLVVTSAYHTRRARYALDRRLDGLAVEVRVVPVADSGHGPDRWWRTEDGLVFYVTEYLKLAHYRVMGRP